MKKRVKFLSTAAAAIAMLFASCSQSDLVQTGSEEATLVKYTLSAESATGRATHDGDGVATNVTRYICEVYTTDGAFYTRVEKPVTKGTLNTTIDLRLVASQSYDVLFWADYAGEAGNADTYYNTKTAGTVNNMSYGLKQVKYAYTYLGNEDKMDAFTGKDQIANLKGTYTKSVTLKRPFAQLNIITKDIQAVMNSAMASTMVPDKVKVSYTAPTQFNVLSGEASEEEAVSYTADVYYAKYATDPATYDYTYCTLAMNYVFAPEGESAVVEVGMDALKGSDTITGETFANIPLQRNYRTNIIGNLLTDAANYTINIAANWDDENDVVWQKVATVAAANEALAAGATNVEVLEAPITDVEIVIPKTFTAGNEESIGVKLPATTNTVTFNYSGDTGSHPANVNIVAGNAEKVIINCEDSHVTLNGILQNVESSTSNTSLIVEEGADIGTLTIKKGGVEIYGKVETLVVNPVSTGAVVFRACYGLSESVYNVAKTYIDSNFVAKQQADGTWNIVTSDFYQDAEGVYHVKSVDGFKAFADAVNGGTTFEGKTIVLDKDIDFQGATVTPIGNFDDNKAFRGVFNGNNKKLSNLTIQNILGKKGVGLFGKVYEPCIIKDLTVENASVIGDKSTAGDKAIAYVGGIAGHGYAKIQNCIFKGNIYAGHQMGGIAGSGGFTIIGCTFEGNIVSERDWGLGGIIGNCQDGGAISGNTAKGTISAKNSDYCGLIAGGIIGCAIYTTYDVKNNYAAMSMSYDGQSFENVYPIVGVYNIDAPGTGDENFAALITTLANNTWDKTISPNDSYVIKYNNEEPVETGYVINHGGATTQATIE